MIEYYKLTPYEALEASEILLIVFPELTYDEAREIYHKGITTGKVIGCFKGTEVSREMIGVGIKIGDEEVIAVLPLHEENKIKNKLKEKLNE